MAFAGGRGAGDRRQGHPLVDVRKPQTAAQGFELDLVVRVPILDEQPATAILAAIVLEPPLRRGDQQILLELGTTAIAGELGPAVIALGGFGLRLDDQDRIEQGIDAVVLEVRLAADPHDVRIGVNPGLLDLDPPVVGVDLRTEPPLPYRDAPVTLALPASVQARRAGWYMSSTAAGGWA